MIIYGIAGVDLVDSDREATLDISTTHNCGSCGGAVRAVRQARDGRRPRLVHEARRRRQRAAPRRRQRENVHDRGHLSEKDDHERDPEGGDRPEGEAFAERLQRRRHGDLLVATEAADAAVTFRLGQDQLVREKDQL